MSLIDTIGILAAVAGLLGAGAIVCAVAYGVIALVIYEVASACGIIHKN